LDFLWAGTLPEPDRSISTAGEDTPPVPADGHTEHRSGVPRKTSQLFSSRHIPEPHHAVGTAGHDLTPIGGTSQVQNRAGVSLKLPVGSARRRRRLRLGGWAPLNRQADIALGGDIATCRDDLNVLRRLGHMSRRREMELGNIL